MTVSGPAARNLITSAIGQAERVLPDLVSLLLCPWCLSDGLVLCAKSLDDGRVVEGELQCGACGRSTHIHEGIWDAMGPHTMARSPAQLTNRLGFVASGYERWWRTRSLRLLSGRTFPISEELAELDRALDSVASQPGIMLDVACSEGLYARHLATAPDTTVVAVDHGMAFLRAMRRRPDAHNVCAVRAPAQHLPFRTGAFDAVAMGGSLNEIGDRSAAVAEMARVSRAGGRLFSMSLTAATSRPGRWLQALLRPNGIEFPSAAETVALFERNDCAIDQPTRTDRVVLRLAATRATE